MRRLALALLLALSSSAIACKPSGGGSGAEASDLFRERTDAELSAAIEDAKAQAKREGKRVLLEFTAPWCSDCREVAKVAAQDPAASVLRDGYVVVPVNVGPRFDHHKALLREHDVKVIAALVVLDADGKRIAKTTLEPISRNAELTPAQLAAWLRAPTDS
jgi:thiol:disulfide interchange protein